MRAQAVSVLVCPKSACKKTLTIRKTRKIEFLI